MWHDFHHSYKSHASIRFWQEVSVSMQLEYVAPFFPLKNYYSHLPFMQLMLHTDLLDCIRSYYLPPCRTLPFDGLIRLASRSKPTDLHSSESISKVKV